MYAYIHKRTLFGCNKYVITRTVPNLTRLGIYDPPNETQRARSPFERNLKKYRYRNVVSRVVLENRRRWRIRLGTRMK